MRVDPWIEDQTLYTTLGSRVLSLVSGEMQLDGACDGPQLTVRIALALRR